MFSYSNIEPIKNGYNQLANLLCKRILSDLERINELKRLYPKLVKIVSFEKLVETPLEAEELYDFAGVQFTDIADIHTDKNSLIENSGHGIFGHFSHVWREKLTFNSIQEIDRNCLDVYTELGLNYILTEEQLKDPNFLTEK